MAVVDGERLVDELEVTKAPELSNLNTSDKHGILNSSDMIGLENVNVDVVESEETPVSNGISAEVSCAETLDTLDVNEESNEAARPNGVSEGNKDESAAPKRALSLEEGESAEKPSNVLETTSLDQVTESDDKVAESHNGVAESEDKVTKSDEIVADSNKKVTECDDEVAESHVRVSESEDKVAESEDKVTQSEDEVTKSEEKVAESDDKIPESADKVTASDDKVAKSDDKIPESDDKVAESDDKVAASDDKDAESDEKVTKSVDIVAESDDKVTKSDDKVTESDDIVNESDDKITESHEKVAISENKVTESEDKVAESIDKDANSEDKVAESSDKVVGTEDEIVNPCVVTPVPCVEASLSTTEFIPCGDSFKQTETGNLASENISDDKTEVISPSVDQNDDKIDNAEDAVSNNVDQPSVPADPLLESRVVSKNGSCDDMEGESESESESESVEGVECCQNAHKFVNDLSSEEKSSAEEIPADITALRKERRQKKRKKRQKRLKKCCSGCDTHGNVEPLSPDLPSPIAMSTGMMQCNVIKSFEGVVSTRYDSEEEIDAAISSYTAVGGRLANQNEQTFSDIDIAGYKSRSECGSPASDPDLLVCDFSNSVGRKLANRNLNQPNDNLDACIGGFLLDSLNQNLDPTSRLFAMGVDELSAMLKGLQLQLQNVNEELVSVVKENDDLRAEKSVITKHVVQLSRLAQGQRANDNSAFRKILVTRETDI